MAKLVLFGAGEFAELAHYYFTHDSPYTVVGFTVDAAYLKESSFRGLPVVPFEEVAQAFPAADHAMFVALGIQKVNQQRAAKVAEVEAKGYRLASFLSSKADVGNDLVLRGNTMIMERAGLQPFVEVGKDTIIWSATRIGFRSRIGDHCWLVAALCGESVTIGDCTFVGLNATIAPSLTIGARNVIGAGALIVKDTEPDEVYRGQASEASRVPSHRLRQL